MGELINQCNIKNSRIAIWEFIKPFVSLHIEQHSTLLTFET